MDFFFPLGFDKQQTNGQQDKAGLQHHYDTGLFGLAASLRYPQSNNVICVGEMHRQKRHSCPGVLFVVFLREAGQGRAGRHMTRTRPSRHDGHVRQLKGSARSTTLNTSAKRKSRQSQSEEELRQQCRQCSKQDKASFSQGTSVSYFPVYQHLCVTETQKSLVFYVIISRPRL